MKISKNLATAVAVGVISAAVTSAYGAFSVTRNGVTWAATYEGDVQVQNSTPAWAGYGGGGSASGSSDGTNWTQTTVDISYLYFEQTDPTWSSAGPQKTIEFRAQVVNQTTLDHAFDVLGSDTNGYWDVQLSSGGVQLEGSTLIGSVIPVDNSTFHTYRLTIDDSLSVDQAKLYLDNNSTPIQTSGTNSPGLSAGNALFFGDLSSAGVGGTTVLDYISWTSGVVPPGGFVITNVVPATIAQGVGISWFATNDITYQVQSTSNLTTNTVWTNFGGPIIGNGKTNMVFDAFGNINSKFYRVLSMQ